MNLKQGVSVIICCYNSGWIINRTLEALKKQYVREGLQWEIILVDNCCVDNTVELAKKAMNNSKIQFRAVKEQRPGLANARKCGITNAKYDIVVYCDDDNLLCPDYIDTMYGIMLSDPQIGAAGGKGIAEYQVEPDNNIRNNEGFYAVGSQMHHDSWLFGAGVTMRTALVREVYQNQRCYLMGRRGGELLSGDDSELVMSMAVRGFRIVPTDDVTYVHVLKADRLTADYYARLKTGLKKPSPVLEVFKMVIDGVPFSALEKKYKSMKRAYRYYSLFFFIPKAKIHKQNYKTSLALYDYWSIETLREIYKEWTGIKMQNCYETFNHHYQLQQ